MASVKASYSTYLLAWPLDFCIFITIANASQRLIDITCTLYVYVCKVYDVHVTCMKIWSHSMVQYATVRLATTD